MRSVPRGRRSCERPPHPVREHHRGAGEVLLHGLPRRPSGQTPLHGERPIVPAEGGDQQRARRET
eukprot:7655403-Pyramimonas_sp.AAC.1